MRELEQGARTNIRSLLSIDESLVIRGKLHSNSLKNFVLLLFGHPIVGPWFLLKNTLHSNKQFASQIDIQILPVMSNNTKIPGSSL